jgi:POT family proton-dependent oligopeptide transporter
MSEMLPASGAKLAQPNGLYLLFIVEMWERFSYYGMRALLVLYLIAGVYATKLPGGGEVNFVTATQATVTTTDGKTFEGEVSRVVDEVDAAAQAKDGNAAKPVRTLVLVTKAADGSSQNTKIPVSTIQAATVTGEGNAGPGWSKQDANTLYGWYTGLAYLLPILGGLIADKFIGTHRSMIVGGLLIAAGHIVLAISGMGRMDLGPSGQALFIGGLALIVIGTGHFKPCVSVMVGQLYGLDDPRRDGGFTLFYMGINIGAFICAFVCGTLGEKVGWHWGFGSAAVGMLMGLGIYMYFRQRYLQGIGMPPEGKPNTSGYFLAGGFALAALVGLLFAGGFFGGLSKAIGTAMSTTAGAWGIPIVILVAIGLMIAWLLSLQAKEDRGTVATILVFIAFNTFFWMAFEQAGSSLNLFAEENTNRMLFGWEVPTSWFQSINAFCVFMTAPLFAALWSRLGAKGRDPKQATKIGLGLLFLGMGYVFMVFGAKYASTGVRVSMFWLVATYVLHTLGELCLSPTGLAFVTKAAPVRFVSLLMGIWFLSSFLAGVLGGYLAATTDAIEQGTMSLPWYPWFRLGGQADYYLLFVIVSGAMGTVALVSSGFFSRILKDKA